MSDRISRREFIKGTLGAASALYGPTIINYLGRSTPSSDKEFLEIRDGKFYTGGEEYTIKGCNYGTKDYPWRMFDEYDPKQIDEELRMAEELGINAVRVGLMRPYAIGMHEKFEKPPSYTEVNKDYFRNFDDFLGIADKYDIKVVPIAFNWIPWKWFKPEKFEWPKNYLENWLPQFKDDERILAWDVNNEPEHNEDTFEKKGKSNIFDVQKFTKEMSNKIQEIDKNHPVTIGTGDTLENGKVKLIEELPNYIEHEDFYCFHFYIPLTYFEPAVDKIKNKTDKPINLEEFGLPTSGDNKHHTEENQERYYGKILEKSKTEDLEGLMFWELNDHPQELTELEIPWGAIYDNPTQNVNTADFGIIRTDYSKKPAAQVVQKYYKWIL